MSRRQKDPLRPLSTEERAELERLSRAQAEPAALVARAKALLAVADVPATPRQLSWPDERAAMPWLSWLVGSTERDLPLSSQDTGAASRNA